MPACLNPRNLRQSHNKNRKNRLEEGKNKPKQSWQVSRHSAFWCIVLCNSLLCPRPNLFTSWWFTNSIEYHKQRKNVHVCWIRIILYFIRNNNTLYFVIYTIFSWTFYLWPHFRVCVCLSMWVYDCVCESARARTLKWLSEWVFGWVCIEKARVAIIQKYCRFYNSTSSMHLGWSGWPSQ